MKSLFEAIYDSMVQAIKDKDADRVLILRTLISDIKSVALKACRKEVTYDDVMSALIKGVKQREDSLSQYTAANRTDLAERESYQISVLKEFLPKQMAEDEVRALVVATVDKLSAGVEKSKKLMGAAMRELGPQLKGKADMKFVSTLLSELLG